ncbi:CheR family methyltransferase [Cellulomonas citrea]|uniref:CheR family methyltransferase n=1 Tax=Cellulomonas citrea TaxID=1909423 RepID=UPI0013596415|nr:protein-glutamate O-methyltransferase CheR [Cellulomonas citrea]
MTLTSDTFEWVATLVRARSAIQLGPGKEYLVESRLLPLARAAGMPGVDAYVSKIRNGRDTVGERAVVEALTTNETSWFRDNSPFIALRAHLLPELMAVRNRPVHLKFWSAACSTGQEPYSLAMTLLDVLPPTVTFEILATDLSEKVLDRARTGKYSQLEINRGLPAPLMVRHFTRVGAEWQVSADLRSRVTFRPHNLLDTPPPGRFDVIFLRNVLIYFDLPTKQQILRRMASVLSPEGSLMLGAAETTIGVDAGWDRVPVGAASVYRPSRAAPAGSPAVPSQSARPGAATGALAASSVSALGIRAGAVR